MFRLLCCAGGCVFNVHWLTVSLLVGVVMSASAQDLRISPAYAVSSKKIEILIEGSSGSGVSGDPVHAQDGPRLTLMEDGKPSSKASEFKTFRATDRGMALVFALDLSGSMKGRPLEAMKTGLMAFIQEASPRDRMALVTFADDIRVDVPFDATSGELERGIQNLTTRGRITELYMGLYKCLELLRAPDLPDRRRLVVITDGKDEGVAYALGDVIDQAKRQGVPVDTIGLTQIDPKYLSICNRLSDLTAGNYINAANLGDLEGILQRASQGLQNSPVAIFSPMFIKPDGTEHRIGVRFDKQGVVLAGEAKLMFPRQSEANAPSAWPKVFRNPYFLGGLALVILLLAAGGIVFARRRRTRLEAEKAAVATAEGLARLREEYAAREVRLKVEQSVPAPESQAIPGVREPQSAPAAKGGRKTVFQSEFRCEAPSIGRPAILLRVDSGDAQGQVFSVETDPCWIGSEEDASVRISLDAFMSGFHAYIRWQGGLLYLFDNQSTNGTFKNDQRLGETSVVIYPGDRIRTGQTLFSVLPA